MGQISFEDKEDCFTFDCEWLIKNKHFDLPIDLMVSMLISTCHTTFSSWRNCQSRKIATKLLNYFYYEEEIWRNLFHYLLVVKSPILIT